MKMLAAAALLASASATEPSFAGFMVRHKKQYRSREELIARRAIYEANVRSIQQHNAEGHSWTMAVNEFADLTGEEFKARFTGGFRAQDHVSRNVDMSLATVKDLPASVDWVAAGAVTAVKNQGQCGSCWSFSTTGSVEGINYISTKNLLSFSEQQLIDCSFPEGDMGCNGGLMDDAFQYIINNKGLCTEDAYPYTSGSTLTNGTCMSSKCTPAVQINSFVNVPIDDDNALASAIAQQPVSIAIEADQSSFQFYSGGVMTAPCGSQLDHGVLAVGYGSLNNGTADVAYWKVKNSWGPSWGLNGYILLGRGAQFGTSGQCGLLSVPSYPTMA